MGILLFKGQCGAYFFPMCLKTRQYKNRFPKFFECFFIGWFIFIQENKINKIFFRFVVVAAVVKSMIKDLIHNITFQTLQYRLMEHERSKEWNDFSALTRSTELYCFIVSSTVQCEMNCVKLSEYWHACLLHAFIDNFMINLCQLWYYCGMKAKRAYFSVLDWEYCDNESIITR